MSGGKLNYIKYYISATIDIIEQEIRNNNVEPRKEDYFEPNNFSEETIAEFKTGINLLKKAQIYAQRIEWLLSGDDSEDAFHKRLSEDLSKMKY